MEGGGGASKTNPVARFNMQEKKWTKSDLRFFKNEGSKRSKINEKGSQLD